MLNGADKDFTIVNCGYFLEVAYVLTIGENAKELCRLFLNKRFGSETETLSN